MKARQTRDKQEIRRLLNHDREWSLYALADLDEGLFEHCEWLVYGSGLALVFRALSIRPIFVTGDAADVRLLLEALPDASGYLNLRPEHLEAARGIYAYRDRHEMHRMILGEFAPCEGDTEILRGEDAAEVRELYRTGEGAGIAFDPRQMESGFFRGIRQRGELVAVAGVHLVSRAESVAGVGNIFTRADCRGRGFARITASAVVTALQADGIQTIGLNVEHTNAPAIRAYEQIGFRRRLEYCEGVAERVSVLKPIEVDAYPMYIGGEFVESGRTFEVRLPYDGTLVGNVSEAGDSTLDHAVRAAREGARVMAAMPLYERAELLTRLHDIVRRDIAEFTRLISLETGKPIREARVETDRALQTIIASAQEARQLRGEVIPIDGAPIGKGRMAMTVREPVGVIGAITPFNVPLNLALHKVGPALAGGNAVVHKPAEKTPLSATRLARALAEAGAPKGAYNLIHGAGPVVGRAMAAHPGIDMLTFTGSVAVGRSLKSMAENKRVTLELGNNSAAILEPDTDLDWAVPRCVAGSFANSGQVCISVQRLYVHESIASGFLERFRKGAEAMKIGHPLDEATELSSLITVAAAERVESWIQEAVAARATMVTGGVRSHATIPPTILTGVPATARLSCEEVFGPVVVVHTYRELDEAIDRVNDGPYGLQAGIFTRDIERGFGAARKLRYGGVLINDVPMFRADHMPYGGMKSSGIGREGPKYAIEEMTELKTIVWKV